MKSEETCEECFVGGAILAVDEFIGLCPCQHRARRACSLLVDLLTFDLSTRFTLGVCAIALLFLEDFVSLMEDVDKGARHRHGND